MLAAVLLVQGAAMIIAMDASARVPGATGTRALLVVAASCAVVLAVIAVASIRRAPRGSEASRRSHGIVAASMVLILAAADALTQLAIEHFTRIAKHG